MTNEPVAIPAEFWRSMNENEFRELILSGGTIRGKFLERLWKILCRTDAMPADGIEVMVKKEDVMRVFPPRKKGTR